ncbi:hypothetical protein BMETH_3261_0 [methanotrophic bacterial endosymbiont of Bathymodiolus sp.]|nr:hypothetical protein BMETH_3261_0 [methanotrophic bacterial endosymbiont of Bathymodiolus sp.]
MTGELVVGLVRALCCCLCCFHSECECQCARLALLFCFIG